MSRSPYSLDYAGNKDDLPEIQGFDDLNFPEELINHMAECGFDKPSALQKDLLKLMHKKISIVGNVPINTGAEHAMLAYSISACLKAKEEGSFKTDQFCPFALFIVGDDQLMEKFYDVAVALTKDLDVSVAKANDELFSNELKCEAALEECDIAILVGDSFYKYIYDDLVYLKHVKIFGVQNLDWNNDTDRMDRYKVLFNDQEFPKVGNRTIIFFDDYYITVQEEVLINDAKACIVYGEGERKPKFVSTMQRQKFTNGSNRNGAINGSLNADRPQFGGPRMLRPKPIFKSNAAVTNAEVPDENVDPERAARGDPKHIFEVAPKEERIPAVLKRLEALLEECGGVRHEFPRTIIYVENGAEAQKLLARISRALQLDVAALDCVKLTKNVKTILENFADGRPRVLIVYNRGASVGFKCVDHYIFMNCNDDYGYEAQMHKPEDKPLTVMCYCTHRDVKKLEQIQKSLEKHNLPLDDLNAIIKDLTPRYLEDPGEEEDDYFFDA